MSTPVAPASSPDDIAKLKQDVAAIRARGHELLQSGATGLQVATYLSTEFQTFLNRQFDAAAPSSEDDLQLLQNQCAVLAVGGTGRRDMAPYSDIDLLFLSDRTVDAPFKAFSSGVVRSLWDAGIKLGHTVQSQRDALAMSVEEPQFATSLVEARVLWGSESLFQRFQGRFIRRCIQARRKAFVQACIAERSEEQEEHGSTINQLEPDIKRSLGGLRDLHLIRWIGFAWYGLAGIGGLRGRGALSYDDARALRDAYEFLIRLRMELHYSVGKANEVLTRDEQLRIATVRGIESDEGQRPVERFMQTYFRHTSSVAEIAEHFADRHIPGSWIRRVMGRLVTHRFDRIYEVGPRGIDVVPAHRDEVCGNLEQVLRLYHAAVLYDTKLTPELAETTRQRIAEIDVQAPISKECGRVFRRILRGGGNTGRVLRSMYATGVLERIIPDMLRTRGLLQFNQYHSFTVDEHTLRAIEAVRRFEYEDSPTGEAYRAIRHKASLHLALLLHDLGKGFEEDHSEVGARIAERVGKRLSMSDHKREMVEFLVLKHLSMPHLAFRRDISDPDLLVRFAHEVGSPERLRMLYVLSAADITAVGPGAWTDWKAELLSDLFNRVMFILSGRSYRHMEEERLQTIKQYVSESVVPVGSHAEERAWRAWIDERLDDFPAHYLMGESPSRIARDLDRIQQLKPEQIDIEGQYDADTETVSYRIITSGEPAVGCFHRLAGVLSGKRMEILSAQISTTPDGVVVDGFRVVDNDYSGPVPDDRIDDVSRAIRSVLTGETSVEEVFQRGKRFDSKADAEPISDLATRVVIDNNSAEKYTVIDVFAHNRPGLLYTIARSIYDLDLSVSLAKISTHLDQVVDVFYVTDAAGDKLPDNEHLGEIRERLLESIRRFEEVDRLQFVS